MFKKIKILLMGILILLFVFSVSVSGNDSFNNINCNKSIFFDGKIISVKYKKTVSNNALKFHIYTDENNNEYIFKDGKEYIAAIRYLRNYNNYLESDFISKDNAQMIANNYIKENFSKTNSYTFCNAKYIEDTQIMNFEYSNFVRNYKTSDIISISIDKYGNIVSVVAPNQGLFYNDNLSIDDSKLNNIFIYTINEKYNTIINYTIVDKYIAKDELGNNIMSYVAKIKYLDGSDESETLDTINAPLQ